MLFNYPWVGIPFDNQIVPLPFGLLLKWSDGTRLEEVLAMRVARVAGFPVLKVLCYGEYLDTTHAPVSILMIRLPGQCLGEAYVEMTDEERKQILSELKCYLDCMRKWSALTVYAQSLMDQYEVSESLNIP